MECRPITSGPVVSMDRRTGDESAFRFPQATPARTNGGRAMTPADPTAKPGKSFAQLRAIVWSDLSRAQKAVLTTLLAYARPDLSVYHAEADLAWESGYTVPTVHAALARLLADGVLTVRQKPRQHYATEYQIHLGKLNIRTPHMRRRPRQSDPEDGPSRPQGENGFPSETGCVAIFG